MRSILASPSTEGLGGLVEKRGDGAQHGRLKLADDLLILIRRRRLVGRQHDRPTVRDDRPLVERGVGDGRRLHNADLLHFLEDALRKGHVLVHCAAGISRVIAM